MWKNLHTIHKSTNYLAHMDKICILCVIKAAKGMDIPKHLTKLKHTWEQITFTRNLRKIYNDNFFKQQIAASLLQSWDAFTTPYVWEYKDEDASKVPKQLIDSQQLIGLISQEYKHIKACKCEEITIPLQGENAHPSLASYITDPSSPSNHQKKKHHCKHCSKDGHFTDQCWYLGKNKCHNCRRFSHEPGSYDKQNTVRRPECGRPECLVK